MPGIANAVTWHPPFYKIKYKVVLGTIFCYLTLIKFEQQKNLCILQRLSTWARRFELPTFWSVAKRSIQLSYAHI